MQLLRRFQPTRSGAVYCSISSSIVAVLLISMPERFAAAAKFALRSLIDVAPLIVAGVLLSAWVTASGAGGLAAQALRRRPAFAILAASAAGAVTPVCGITVLPLIAGFLSSGVPLAPIMAFWLSSPITEPAMLAVTAATLGTGFAVGKSLATLGLRLLHGPGPAEALWRGVGRHDAAPPHLSHASLHGRIRAERASRASGPLVGAPAYIDGYAPLPLTRSLINHGLSQGAAMAFLMSGGVISIWRAMAILPVLRLRAFLLYVLFGVSGSK